MSKLAYTRLVKDVADAYRTASGSTDTVKYGELAEKIEGLHTAEKAIADSYYIAADATADADITSTASVILDISNTRVALTGTTAGKISTGDTVGLSSGDFDLSETTKQWQQYIGDLTPDNMVASQADETICILSGRRYRKSRDGRAFVGYMFNGSYTGPLLVSDVSADAVIYNGGSGEKLSSGTVEFNGKTFWYNSGEYWMGGNISDTSGLNRYKIPGTSTLPEAALALIKLVTECWWSDIPGADGETYTVTAEDSGIRCKVTGHGDLTGTATSNEAKTE